MEGWSKKSSVASPVFTTADQEAIAEPGAEKTVPTTKAKRLRFWKG